MNIHEHQAKAVLAEFGVPVPRGYPAFSVDEAVAAAEKLGGPVWVVKAQIHAGGRGKGGGVKLARSIDEVRAEADQDAGHDAGHPPDRPQGQAWCSRLYIEEGAAIAKELYLSLLVDRETSRVAVVASTEGGMDIEEVAHSTPEKIITFSIDPATGVWPHHGLQLAEALGLKGDPAKQARALLPQLYKAFVEKDMSLLEINPLIVTTRRLDQGARRQGRLRRQRPLPPPGSRRPARRERGRRQGDRGLQVRPLLHRPRRRHRLHGQRRGPGHGDHGHHQALRRRAGQLPRRRRRGRRARR